MKNCKCENKTCACEKDREILRLKNKNKALKKAVQRNAKLVDELISLTLKKQTT